jgi:hypothetical protein
MRTKLFALTSILILATLLAGCSTPALVQAAPLGQATDANTKPPRTLNVNGSGKAFLTPDIAYINVGVHTEGPSAAEAVAENNRLAQAVQAALKKMGVAEKDIQTTNFSIYPQTQYDTEGKPTGKVLYIVDNTVFVTARDLTKIGELLDTVVQAGANSINGISFDVADKTAALSAARKAAVENARLKAEELAQAAGVTIGAVQTITEYSSNPTPIYEAKLAMDAPSPSAVPIAAGQMTLTVEVNIVYEIQ